MAIVLSLASYAHGFMGKITTHLRPGQLARNAHICCTRHEFQMQAATTLSYTSRRSAKIRVRPLAVSQLSTDASISSHAYDEQNKALGIVGKYEPTTFESNIYSWWERSGCFLPDAKLGSQKTDKQPYVIPMPPPNVTGRLHMGHAIFVALQDVLARFHRMRGRPVLWLPGTDHAGIATQLQVEKLLLSQGKNVQFNYSSHSNGSNAVCSMALSTYPHHFTFYIVRLRYQS